MRIIIFFFLLSVSLAYFSYSLFWRLRYICLGKKEQPDSDLLERWTYLFKRVFLNEKIREFPIVAILHSFIFWGFIVLTLSSFDLVAVFLFGKNIPFIGTNAGFALLRNIFLLLTLVAVIGFTVRRLYIKERWLHSSYKAYGILWLIAGIVLAELLYLVGSTKLGQLSSAESPLAIGVEVCWWLHFLLIFSFFFIIPNTKHLHLVFAPFNVYWHSTRTKGALPPVADLNLNSQQDCGLKTIEDFTRKQLLDTFSCVLCGRCHKYCASELSNERLKPKRINGFIRSYLEEEGRQIWQAKTQQAASAAAVSEADQFKTTNAERGTGHKIQLKKVVGDLFSLDFIWSCTTCGACNEFCPLEIDHLSKIIGMRRNIISENNNIPEELQQVFHGIENCGNPFALRRADYPDNLRWLSETGCATFKEKPTAEYLLFFGCQALFEQTAQQAAKATIKLLQTAGLDLAVLAEAEWCCGDPARRTGNELLYQKTVLRNIAQFTKLGVKKIITLCPHCFNTFKNEYPQFGGAWELVTHTALIAELIAKGKLTLPQDHKLPSLSSADKVKIAYHDPCYLARYNSLTTEPRKILASLPGFELVEMPRNREKSFCCGAGGGRYWTRLQQPNPIIKNRTEQALTTGASVLVTACPYCHRVFQEELARRGQEHQVSVLDIAEMISLD